MSNTQGAGERAPVMNQKLFISLRIENDFQRKSCPPEFLITFFVSVLFIKMCYWLRIQFLVSGICSNWGSSCVRMTLFNECSLSILNETMGIPGQFDLAFSTDTAFTLQLPAKSLSIPPPACAPHPDSSQILPCVNWEIFSKQVDVCL